MPDIDRDLQSMQILPDANGSALQRSIEQFVDCGGRFGDWRGTRIGRTCTHRRGLFLTHGADSYFGETGRSAASREGRNPIRRRADFIASACKSVNEPDTVSLARRNLSSMRAIPVEAGRDPFWGLL